LRLRAVIIEFGAKGTADFHGCDGSTQIICGNP
jgi:hypothetical protein